MTSAGSLLVATVGVWLILLRMRADHERSRRTRTIELMEFYYSVFRKDHLLSPCIRLADSLGPAELQSLWDGRIVSVTGEARELAEMIATAKGFGLQEENGVITLNRETSFFIRQQVISQLNALEVLSAAWLSGTVDNELFEQEFKSVFMPNSGKPALTDFVEKSGIFPATRAMRRHFRPSEEMKERGKVA